MTPKEAIEIIKVARAEVEWNYPMEYAVAFDEAIEALEDEKRTPKKPIRTNISSNAFTTWRRYNCPCCEKFLYSGASTQPIPQNYCHKCGQMLDWSDAE